MSTVAEAKVERTKKPNHFNRKWTRWKSWMSDARPAWIFLGLVVVASIAVDWAGWGLGAERVTRLPYIGWVLELAGISLVALGLATRLRLFDEASIPARIGKWFRVRDLMAMLDD
jgi:hypothetical protein